MALVKGVSGTTSQTVGKGAETGQGRRASKGIQTGLFGVTWSIGVVLFLLPLVPPLLTALTHGTHELSNARRTRHLTNLQLGGRVQHSTTLRKEQPLKQ